MSCNPTRRPQRISGLRQDACPLWSPYPRGRPCLAQSFRGLRKPSCASQDCCLLAKAVKTYETYESTLMDIVAERMRHWNQGGEASVIRNKFLKENCSH